MSKILVTGGAGYIGSVLVPQLLTLGHTVTVVDNFYYNQSSLLDCCVNPDFIIIRGDVRDKELMSKLVVGQDYIIPLAAIVGFPRCEADKLAATTINFDAIKMLFELRSKEQKVIYPCTNSGYGKSENGMCTEESPLNPVSLYGKTKTQAESLVLSEENTLTFRFATLFGASPRPRIDLLVNDFVYRAVYDRAVVIFEGHFRRNYCHIRDAVGAIIHAINNFDSMKGKAYNCGLSSANLTKKELCEKIKEHFPGFVYLEALVGEDPDKRDYLVSNERLEATGWKPQYTIDDGIEEMKKVFQIIRNNTYSNI